MLDVVIALCVDISYTSVVAVFYPNEMSWRIIGRFVRTKAHPNKGNAPEKNSPSNASEKLAKFSGKCLYLCISQSKLKRRGRLGFLLSSSSYSQFCPLCESLGAARYRLPRALP